PTNIGPLRWGVGRLIVDTYRKTGVAPLVVPFVHRGMHVNMPRHEECYVIPLPREPIRVLVGDPIDLQTILDSHLRARKNNSGWGEPFPPGDEDAYEKVTNQIREALCGLQSCMDEIVIQEDGPDSPSLSNKSLYHAALR
ncbi:hypothetical protein AAMO2058_001585800, partial [Amorphochlora amoebiformis]